LCIIQVSRQGSWQLVCVCVYACVCGQCSCTQRGSCAWV
jgi:hypothetical protein